MTGDRKDEQGRGGRSGSDSEADETGGAGNVAAASAEQAIVAAERLAVLAGELTGGAFRLAVKSGTASLKMANRLLQPDQLNLLAPEQLKRMHDTGMYLRDLREVAGLTVADLSRSLDLKDQTLMEAVESGTATLSFELILRLAALLARHDPVPFVMRLARSYNPDLWKVLEDWGLGRLSLHIERERQFINIYRRHDAARQLSDDGFARVLEFTRSAFEMALHFIAEQESIPESDAKGKDRG